MASQPTQKCLYEILGVEVSSSIDEIRSAYRKLALKWHPDKIQQSGASPEACQEATIRFQEIGKAYEVLADPTERAWYDSHRAQILSSSASPSGAPQDFDFNVWPYFSTTVFSGYGESGQGFYAVYSDVFQKLHQQEKAFVRAYGGPPVVDSPSMGGLGTGYAQVTKFYNHWLGFSTVKDFSWCDEYRITLAPNRKVRRLMEEENKKIRSKARKEFNDSVRRLAAFVKKRDKRVLERQLEVQRLRKEKEQMLKLRRQQAAAEKIMKAKQYQEAEWTKLPNDEGDRDDDDETDDDENLGSYDWGGKASKGSSTKDDQAEFYCIICSKKFKSDKQWRNHERSKKHMDRAASLKDSFEEEDEDEEEEAMPSSPAINEENEEYEDGLASSSTKENEEDDEDGLVGSSMNETAHAVGNDVETSSNLSGLNDNNLGTENNDALSSTESSSSDKEAEDDEASILLAMLNSHTSRRQRNSGEKSPLQNGTSVKEEQKSDGEGEEAEILKATVNSHGDIKQVEDEEEGDIKQVEDEEDQKSEGLGTEMSLTEEDFLEVRNDEALDLDLKKRKSKRRVRIEKKQAAALGRHAALAELASLEKKLDRVSLDSEDLGKRKMTADVKLFEGEQRDESKLCERPDSQDDATLKDLGQDSGDKNSGQVLGNKQSRVPKPNKAMKSAPAQSDQGRKPAKGKKSKGSSKIATITCETCGEDFESRNQLFKHISSTNHSVLRGK